MLVAIFDLLLINILFTVIIYIVIFFWLTVKIEEISNTKVATLFFVLFSVIIPALGTWGYIYKFSREKQGIAASISSITTSLDVAISFLISISPFILLFIVAFTLIGKICRKIVFNNNPYSQGPEMLAGLILIISFYFLYGIAIFGNCLFFDIFGFGQRVFFHDAGPVIDTTDSDDSLFEVSPKCSRVYIEDVNIYNTSLKLSNFYTRPINLSIPFNPGGVMKDLIDLLLKIISPIADILGIYHFIESRRKKKSNGN
jgi:hypothetical protein